MTTHAELESLRQTSESILSSLPTDDRQAIEAYISALQRPNISEALIESYVKAGNVQSLCSIFSMLRTTQQRAEAERDIFMWNMHKMAKTKGVIPNDVKEDTLRALDYSPVKAGQAKAEPKKLARTQVKAKPALSSIADSIEL